eukprot:5260668-Pyramimonas_sp.AAC.1
MVMMMMRRRRRSRRWKKKKRKSKRHFSSDDALFRDVAPLGISTSSPNAPERKEPPPPVRGAGRTPSPS